MLLKRLIYLAISISSINLSAQTFDRNVFLLNTWFSINVNNEFYNSDTIDIIRIQKFNSYNDSINERNIIFKYIGYKDITEVQFNKSGRLSILNRHIENWTYSWKEGKWKWRYDKENQILRFYRNKKLDTVFKVVSFETDNTTWNMINDSKLNILKIRLKRIKNN